MCSGPTPGWRANLPELRRATARAGRRTPRDSSTLTAKVHWKGGRVTIIELAKGRADLHRYVSPPELVELIRRLAGEFTDAQIARILRRKKPVTPKGHSFMAFHVANVRLKHAIAPGSRVLYARPVLDFSSYRLIRKPRLV